MVRTYTQAERVIGPVIRRAAGFPIWTRVLTPLKSRACGPTRPGTQAGLLYSVPANPPPEESAAVLPEPSSNFQ
ncbi:MAG TPA: hypothetical protein P5555_15190 [Candidatus Paceibacterota bacterium]|nr:hypothetical protein [Verrucomicrobiota bacterium]HOX03593.1 hypothetical protein [Verrucomicrobiota bacterium]HRZ46527.1 hypothetical protein [Candidatus Paceibacterota bacterium]